MLTRLDCMLGSAAMMRMALAQAIHHCRHRRAFGKRAGRAAADAQRAGRPGDRVRSRAGAVACASRARSMRAPRDPREAAFARIATAIGKYWICKRAPAFVNEAQECLGGAGYVEESILPRLYRQAPLNSIWEGSGNIQCLDVLRALAKEPETGAALWTNCSRRAATMPTTPAQSTACARRSPATCGSMKPARARSSSSWRWPCRASMLLRAGSPVAQAVLPQPAGQRAWTGVRDAAAGFVLGRSDSTGRLRPSEDAARSVAWSVQELQLRQFRIQPALRHQLRRACLRRRCGRGP